MSVRHFLQLHHLSLNAFHLPPDLCLPPSLTLIHPTPSSLLRGRHSSPHARHPSAEAEAALERGSVETLASRKDERHVTQLAHSFANDWKRAIDAINAQVMR